MSEQPTAPPSFADVVGLDEDFSESTLELENESTSDSERESEHMSALGPEDGLAQMSVFGLEDELERTSAYESEYEDAFTAESEIGFTEEAESPSQKDEPYYSLEGYIGPATLQTQLPPIPAVQLGADDDPPVDPQSAPYQPKLGVFRIAVVGVMAVLFGTAIALLFCLVVMHLLGI